jgi:ankyrin repeat protein
MQLGYSLDAPDSEVIAWLKFHSFLDVNIPVRLVPQDSADNYAVIEDRTLGITPLMAACRSLCVDLVRCLLEHGAVVWLATANGDTGGYGHDKRCS